MGLRFIFMLTSNDRTVEDAEIHLGTALAAGIHHIGFKDIGLSFDRLKNLNSAIKSGGATSYLEVVSLDKKSEIIKRLKKRKNFNLNLYNQFKKIQLPLSYKKKKSNHIIKNNFTNKFVKISVKKILKKII